MALRDRQIYHEGQHNDSLIYRRDIGGTLALTALSNSRGSWTREPGFERECVLIGD